MAASSRALRWVFTLNNWTQEEHDLLCSVANDESKRVRYLVFGKEVGEQGTPHLQGYVEFEAAVRFTTVKNRLGLQRAHVEVAKGSAQQNREYCTKEGDFEEFGEVAPVGQGRRTDLERFYEWADAFAAEHSRAPTTPEIASEYPVVLTKYRHVREVVNARVQRGLFIDDPQPRQWQTALEQKLNAPPDDRKIIFVVDPDGNNGKSWFCRWWLDKHPTCTQVLSVGRNQDVAHAIREHTKYFLFDIPRDGLQYLQKQVLEQLKDRLVFSPKYSSRTKILCAVPHVVVFTNEHPVDVELTMTEDRFDYLNVN